ncbi:MAG: GerW family sporulation protein [Halanaerobiales bacterium]
MNETKNVLESMYDRLDHFLKTETVIGDPIEVGSVKLIPIISTSFGLGGGFGEDNEANAGGGGGLGCKISPDAILVVRDDNVEMLPVKSKKSLEKLFEQVPEIISKLDKGKENKEKEAEENEEKE